MTQQMSAIGRIATDPKLFTPHGGAPFCTFRLACTERRFDQQRNEWIDGDTNWFTVNSFRNLAQHAHLSFQKGDRIVVSGKLRVRAWESEERRGISVEIDADGLGHDVRFGISSFTKQPASLAGAGGDLGTEPEDENGETAALASAPVAGGGEANADAGGADSASSGDTSGFVPTEGVSPFLPAGTGVSTAAQSYQAASQAARTELSA